MKTLIFSVLLLLTAAVQADQWYYQGKLYKGTAHKFNADKSKIWVTTDWDSYLGQWQNVSDLDAATRVLLNVATPEEKAAVAKAKAEREAVEKENAAIMAAYQEKLRQQQAADTEAKKMAMQQEILELLRRQEAARQRQQEIYLYLPGYGGGGGNGIPAVPQVPAVPGVP